MAWVSILTASTSLASPHLFVGLAALTCVALLAWAFLG